MYARIDSGWTWEGELAIFVFQSRFIITRGVYMKAASAVFMVIALQVIQATPVSDSLRTTMPSFNRAQMESTIVFLEDSQRVQSLAADLKRLLASQEAVTTQSDHHDTKGTVLPINLFTPIKSAYGKTIETFSSFGEEFSSIQSYIGHLRVRFGEEEFNERMTSLLILLSLSIAAGFLVWFLLFRCGQHFKKLTCSVQGHLRKVYGALFCMLNRCSFGAGVIVTGICIAMLPSGLNAGNGIRMILLAIGVYAIADAMVHVFLQPRDASLRLLPFDDTTALDIGKRWGVLARFSLIAFVVVRGFYMLNRTGIAIAVLGIFNVILTILVFRFTSVYRDRYSRAIVAFFEKHAMIPSKVRSFLASFVGKAPMILFFLMTAMTLASLVDTAAYLYLLYGSLQTALVVVALVATVLFWEFVVNRIKTGPALINRSEDLRSYFERNFRILEKGGYGAILLAGGIFFINAWGGSVLTVFRSDNIIVRSGVHVLTIVIITFALIQALFILINRIQKEAATRMAVAGKSSPAEIEKRVSTLGGIIRKISLSTIIVIAIMMIMDELGFDIKAMLAGVGIIGLAVGFGAQNLVRDVISGLFLIFENRIRVGDVAIINGTGGLVEQVNLRTTVLRSNDGTIHVFPNGAINSLSNMTHEWSCYVFDIGVAYKEDTDRVISVLKGIGEEILEEPQYKEAILAPLEIMGVDSFGNSSVVIKARIKTLPIKQWFVGREMNRRIKKRFDELGIEIPFPHQSIYFGEASKPVSVRLESLGADTEQIRKIVQEALDERERMVDQNR